MKNQKVKDQVEWAHARRLMNSEYQQGFMEGQHEAVKQMAGCIDQILERFNNISSVNTLSLDIERIGNGQRK